MGWRCVGSVSVAMLWAAAPAGAADRPDLAVARVTASGVTASCSDKGCRVRLTARARVVNRGSRRARATKLGFLLSRDARPDSDDRTAGSRRIAATRGGRRRTARVALTFARVEPGVHRLIACADVTRRVRERREGNNCRAGAPFTVKRSEGSSGPAPAPAPSPARQGCREAGWRTDLCAEIASGMASRLFFDMADVVTFALLYQHYRTGQAIPSSVAAGVIEPLRTGWDPVRGQAGLTTYRVAGFLDFWVYSSYAGVDWPRYPLALDTPEEFAGWWQTYQIVQATARQNAINNSLNAVIESEAAWRNAMDDWKAYDLRLITAQQHSDATVFAHRTYEDAAAAVDAASNAIKGPP